MTRRGYERGSPLARVHAHAPAFLVVQGTSDNLVFPAESRAFVDELRTTSRAAVAYAEVPRAQHEFDAVASIRTGHVINGVARFLDHVRSEYRQTAPSSTTDLSSCRRRPGRPRLTCTPRPARPSVSPGGSAAPVRRHHSAPPGVTYQVSREVAVGGSVWSSAPAEPQVRHITPVPCWRCSKTPGGTHAAPT